jgi:hypothetical protein
MFECCSTSKNVYLTIESIHDLVHNGKNSINQGSGKQAEASGPEKFWYIQI